MDTCIEQDLLRIDIAKTNEYRLVHQQAFSVVIRMIYATLDQSCRDERYIFSQRIDWSSWTIISFIDLTRFQEVDLAPLTHVCIIKDSTTFQCELDSCILRFMI